MLIQDRTQDPLDDLEGIHYFQELRLKLLLKLHQACLKLDFSFEKQFTEFSPTRYVLKNLQL